MIITNQADILTYLNKTIAEADAFRHNSPDKMDTAFNVVITASEVYRKLLTCKDADKFKRYWKKTYNNLESLKKDLY